MKEQWNSGIEEYWNIGRRPFRFAMLLLLLACSYAQGAVKTYAIRLPVTAVVAVSDDSGTTWRCNGAMPVTYASTVNQMKACLGGQGWRVKQVIVMGEKKDRTLLSFENGKRKITVMIWRIDLAQTGFSWGIVE